MSMIASQITGISIIYSTVCLGADQQKHQSSSSLDFVRGSHRSAVKSTHKGPVTRKMFPFDDVHLDDIISKQRTGPGLNTKTVLQGVVIPITKKRPSSNCLSL